MAGCTLEQAREILEFAIGPEELVSHIPEFGFKDVKELLSTNGLSGIPALPSLAQCQKAKEQNKALIFRIAQDASNQPIHLLYFKEHFGPSIYSSWFVGQKEPFAQETCPVGWALTDLNPLEGTTEKIFEDQVKFAESQGARIKTVIADVYDLLVTHKAAGKFFRGHPVNGRTVTEAQNSLIKVSNFDKRGMCISTAWGPTIQDPDIGAVTELTGD